ncbi:MAG: type II secretion system secretin GspD [Pseudomonadota bacterium]
MKRTHSFLFALWLIPALSGGALAQSADENALLGPATPMVAPAAPTVSPVNPVLGPPNPVVTPPAPSGVADQQGFPPLPPPPHTRQAPPPPPPLPSAPRMAPTAPPLPPAFSGGAVQTPPAYGQPRGEPGSRNPKGFSITKKEGKDLVNLDFVNADIAELAKSISELTKRNFIMDDKVHGKVTIISPKPVTSDEAYQAFISALAVQNFTVVPAGKMFKIVPLRDMKNNPIPTNVEAPLGGDDTFVTRLIPIRFISSAEIVKSLRNLLSKNGDIISYDPTNTLIITDAVGNMRRMIKIITMLDRQGNQESLEVIRLKYASAPDVVEKIMTLFDLKGGTRGQPTPGAQDVTSGAAPFISKVLADDRSNSIIVMATQEGIRRVREIVNTFDQSLEAEAEKGRIHVLYLQHADATELVGTLSSLTGSGGARPGSGKRPGGSSYSPPRNQSMFPTMGQPAPSSAPPQAMGSTSASLQGTAMFEGEVHITADVPTNAVVITASAGDYKSLMPVIRKLDIRRPQAFVEAMIMEVDVDKALNVGTAMHLGKQFSSGRSLLFGGSEFSNISSLSFPTSATGFITGAQGRSIDITTASGTTASIPIYGAMFRALQTNGTINILSTPNILTSDNKEAEIVVGQVVPFVTAQGRDINNQPINQIQRENVAITLRVTPQINLSDDVTMDIYQEVQDIIPGTDQNALGPTTSNRSAKTTVTVKDAQTVSIGGLINDKESTSISKVPVLGDIPLIGWFFKTKSRTKTKTSLVIFLTPHIVRMPQDLETLSIRKNKQRQSFMDENNIEEHPALLKYKMDHSLKVPQKAVESPSPVSSPPVPPVPAGSPSGNFLPPPQAPEEIPVLPPVEATPAEGTLSPPPDQSGGQ